jgi:hypothetical protein
LTASEPRRDHRPGYLGTLDKATELRGPELAVALGPAPDAMATARTGGIRAARLATIRADVLANRPTPGSRPKDLERLR